MARITVEDCLHKMPNRFQLVLAATYRARMLSQGHAPKIESKNKPGVTALREIAAGEVGVEMLRRGADLTAAQRLRAGKGRLRRPFAFLTRQQSAFSSRRHGREVAFVP